MKLSTKKSLVVMPVSLLNNFHRQSFFVKRPRDISDGRGY